MGATWEHFRNMFVNSHYFCCCFYHCVLSQDYYYIYFLQPTFFQIYIYIYIYFAFWSLIKYLFSPIWFLSSKTSYLRTAWRSWSSSRWMHTDTSTNSVNRRFDKSEWWTPWMHWPLSCGRPFHPPSLLSALHPSISIHVDETEIDEDISDGQPFHSNTPNEFWLPQPTLLCRRLILSQDACRLWQSCVEEAIIWR